ncbi:MAG TPA: efflux RND transporter periplasmic adaptor subunit [Methylovirgula sp.]
MKKLWRGVVWIAVLGVALALMVPLFTSGSKMEPSPTAHGRHGHAAGAGQPTPVLVAVARAADVPVYVEGVGTVKPLQSVLVRSQVDGVIQSMPFKEGQDVHRGDLLVQIKPELYQAQLDQAVAKKAQDEATLANARLDLTRYTNLAKTKAATTQQLDTQRATVAQDEAQVKLDAAAADSARTTLGYTHITSPIDGRTGLRVVDPGNLVHASDATGLVTVSQIQPISVVFVVPQQQLPRIIKAKASGALPVYALDNAAQTPVDTGTLDVIDNQIDQTTGTVKLKAIFPNKDLQLWPGGFVTVRLLIETLKNAIVVPVAALQRGPKGPFVFVLDGKIVHIRQVTPSQQDDKEVVITAGLKPGESVVTTGFVRLTEGSHVNPTIDEGAAASGAPALHQATGAAPPSDASATPGHGHGHYRKPAAPAPAGPTQ